VADSATEARIRDLKRRMELEPSSRLFVALAEEYRKSGRLADALSTLQKGLLAHPNYLSAHVALGRAYLEAGQITEAIATFSKVLSSDPGNLVSAKSLADIFLSRGDSVEAIKKYKLYRALSGDRSVDDIIERLEVELAPPPPPASKEDVPPPPPPTFFDEKLSGPIRKTRDTKFDEPLKPRPPLDLDMTSVKFEPDESIARARSLAEAEPLPLSRDLPLMQTPPPAELASAPTLPLPLTSAPEVDAVTRVIPMTEAFPPAPAASASAETPFEADEEPAPVIHQAEAEEEPHGRVLADLYFAQGHYADALAIYDDLVAASPYDEELRRLRRDAEARLLPAAATTPTAATPDTALERRLGKIRALKRWLSVVQTG
jgi:tetratricopeptide (TPR) repeat protein